MISNESQPVYHVLLVGIDRYPSELNCLNGCVNDIDAVEQLLLDPPGIGFPRERIRITRLAAARDGRQSTSRCQAATRHPSKANLVQALQALAGPEVKPGDRVLIYYSGHGYQTKVPGSLVWHETLVPNDGRVNEFLFDYEINPLIQAIAARTSDLTVILDSCHSAGATRDLTGGEAKGAVRTLRADFPPALTPDWKPPERSSQSGQRSADAPMLQTLDSGGLVVVACQANEPASEGAPSGQAKHGVFTYSLLSVLGEKDASRRAGLRWADLWPELLARVAERNAQLQQNMQHPWLIGRSERKVFGGSWEKMDTGFRAMARRDGEYEVGAGSLMNVTVGAEIAVYGAAPLLFPAVGSPKDLPVGRLVVISTTPSRAVARLVGEGFPLPEGARGRLVKPGESRHLRVSIKPPDEKLAVQLAESPLLAITSPSDPGADVEVVAQAGGGWVIGSDAEPVVAAVPAGENKALRAGLEHYYRYATVLSMARSCNDPQLTNCLQVRILDCSNEAALRAMSPEDLADPDLPEAARDEDQIYHVSNQFPFCIKVTNFSSYCLNVTLFDCSSGGSVYYLGDAILREPHTPKGESQIKPSAQVLWLQNLIRNHFCAYPDKMPPSGIWNDHPLPYVTDRLIAIGTTRTDVDLNSLTLEKTVQEIVEDNLIVRRGFDRGVGPKPSPAAPAELWTAAVTPIRISRQ
jgi:hypothetical protein